MLVGIIMTFNGLYSMEAPLKPEKITEPYIFLANDSSYKLKVSYITDERPLEETILPHSEMTLHVNPRSVSLFKVSPSGEYLQYTQFREPEDLAPKIHELAEKNPGHFIQVTIEPETWTSTAVAKVPLIGGFLKPLAQLVEEYASFTYRYQALPLGFSRKIKSIVSPDRIIIDAFPQVKFAHAKGQEIVARHFLGIPEGASVDSIKNKYKELKDSWDAEKREHPNNTLYVNKVLEILETAYTELLSAAKLKEYIMKDIVVQPRYPQG